MTEQQARTDAGEPGGRPAERQVVEVFGTAMAGRQAGEVAAELERLIAEDARRGPAERGGDWQEKAPQVQVVGEDTVCVAAETAHADVLAMMLLAAGGRRVCVCIYPDRERRGRWSPYAEARDARKALPEGVRARLVDAWGGKPRVLAPLLAALLIALSLERMGVLVWQAAAVLFVSLAVLVLWIAGRQARYRVEWYRIEQETA